MSALEELNAILTKQSASFVRPKGNVWTQTKHVAEVAKAHGVSAEAIAKAPGRSAEEVAGRLGAERAKGLTAERAQQLGGSPSMARLHPDVRGVVRGVAHPQALPGKDPGSVAQSAKLRAEGARQALRESVSLSARTAPTITATEKVSPQLAAARGRTTPEQRSVVIPEKKYPSKFEAKHRAVEAKSEAEAVVRGKEVSQQLGHERSKDIATNVDTLRGQQTLEMATTKPAEKPYWVPPSKHEVRTELAAKYDKKVAPSRSPAEVREVHNVREALRTHLRGKEILAKRTAGMGGATA